jgi:uncharacterized damage-inducible protein DinB
MSGHLDAFIQSGHRIHKQSTKIMAVAPNDKYDWKPADSAMTLGKLMNHLKIGELALVEAAINGAFPATWPEDINDTEALIASFDAQHNELSARIAALAPEQLDEMVAPFGPGKEMPRRAILQVLHEHEIHHRGQLYTYLRMLLGDNVPPLFA